MNDGLPFLGLDQPCNVAVDWLTQQISQAGLFVMRTFDLQVARKAQVSCWCPEHGEGPCDCQLVVLLVYMFRSLPLTLVACGKGGKTWLSLVDTPQQRADPTLERMVRTLCIDQPGS